MGVKKDNRALDHGYSVLKCKFSLPIYGPTRPTPKAENQDTSISTKIGLHVNMHVNQSLTVAELVASEAPRCRPSRSRPAWRRALALEEPTDPVRALRLLGFLGGDDGWARAHASRRRDRRSHDLLTLGLRRRRQGNAQGRRRLRPTSTQGVAALQGRPPLGLRAACLAAAESRVSVRSPRWRGSAAESGEPRPGSCRFATRGPDFASRSSRRRGGSTTDLGGRPGRRRRQVAGS